MDLNKSVRIATLKRDMTIPDLADKMNVSRQRIYSILKQPRLHKQTLSNLAYALDMKVSELIKLSE